MQKRNLDEVLDRVSEQWAPKKVADLNDYEVKVVKVLGEFVWHQHDETDEFFYVLSGDVTIQLRDGDVALTQGDVYVVPRGVEHCPKAAAEVRLMLIEPRGVVNTGDAGGELTHPVEDLT